MKFEKNPKYNTYALLALIVVAFAGALVSLAVHAESVGALVSKLLSVLAPLFYAAIIMLVLLPGVDFFYGRFCGLLKKQKNCDKNIPHTSLFTPIGDKCSVK